MVKNMKFLFLQKIFQQKYNIKKIAITYFIFKNIENAKQLGMPYFDLKYSLCQLFTVVVGGDPLGL